MSKQLVAMISSTVQDLPDYRSMVMDACLRADIFPKMMDHLPALDSDAIEASIAMVNISDIYIGIFAHRYGHIPKDYDISITEMEYNRAVERGIPRLIFIISEDVPVKPRDIDKGEKGVKLEILKEKLQKTKVADFFESPKDLRGLVINSLNKIKERFEENEEEPKTRGEEWAKSLHRTSEVPIRPEPFKAHPYTLLQVKGLIGRQKELEMLTDWITESNRISIFNIVAIGGMGKSALTWHWFNNIAPQEKTWEGRVWWSFYETDATFDSFITKTLAYVSGTSLDELKWIPASKQQARLFQILNNESYLIVLDGLERILIAYARQDAAFIDDSALDDQTANEIAGAMGLPESGGKSYVGRHRLRKTTDARVGHFLRQLSQIQKSKILISTRLYPTDLQTHFGQPFPRCAAHFLEGLSDQDALELWRAYGAKGSREKMLPIFQSFDKHPLLLQLLASEVAEFRTAPGDFDAWKRANPNFNVFGLPLVQVQSHVLSYALKGLSAAELQTLQTIAGFRMPASMTTLKALLLEKRIKEEEEIAPLFSSESSLDQALTVLEDKGLLGWDRRSNRYDLHPIVRGVVWNNLEESKQFEIHGSLRTHFEAMPIIEDYRKVESIEDLRPAIELYNSLIQMKMYTNAYLVFRDRIDKATKWRLSANNLRVELLERLFVEGNEQLPAISSRGGQSYIMGVLADGYDFIGLPSKSLPMREREKEMDSEMNHLENLASTLSNSSGSFTLTGQLFKAEWDAKKGLLLGREINKYYAEIINLERLGIAYSYRGFYEKAEKALRMKISLAMKRDSKQNESIGKIYLSRLLLFDGKYELARDMADNALKLAVLTRNQRDLIRAVLCRGLAASRLDDAVVADDFLHFALQLVRSSQVIGEELQILTALAELFLKQDKIEKAREYLDEVWGRAKEGPYPLFHADALNTLAQIEMVVGNKQEAITAATEAYKKAWCDGPPYAYHYGLENSKRLLKELDAEEPEMPPFDPSKFEPMPEVEIDPEGLLE
jgi:tetratricopeptide (TPR) repeat protein